ncbi:hypothetical protein SRHO_G00300260 [Serrasalmus rhombeus]
MKARRMGGSSPSPLRDNVPEKSITCEEKRLFLWFGPIHFFLFFSLFLCGPGSRTRQPKCCARASPKLQRGRAPPPKTSRGGGGGGGGRGEFDGRAERRRGEGSSVLVRALGSPSKFLIHYQERELIESCRRRCARTDGRSRRRRRRSRQEGVSPLVFSERFSTLSVCTSYGQKSETAADEWINGDTCWQSWELHVLNGEV